MMWRVNVLNSLLSFIILNKKSLLIHFIHFDYFDKTSKNHILWQRYFLFVNIGKIAFVSDQNCHQELFLKMWMLLYKNREVLLISYLIIIIKESLQCQILYAPSVKSSMEILKITTCAPSASSNFFPI